MPRSYAWFAAMGLCLLAVAEPLCPHPDECISGKGFVFAADRRVFAVFAFMNAMGYDHEAKGVPMHPVRQKVREMVAATLRDDSEEVQRWRTWYRTNGGPSWVFEDYAVALSTQRPFRLVRPANELHYETARMRFQEFPGILEEFWVAAGLDRVWSAVKPDYLTELRKCSPEKAGHELDFLWKYLRMPRADTLTLVTVPNLLQAHYEAIGAQYDRYHYSVESPGALRYSLNMHEYLHSVVNSIVESNYAPHREKLDSYFSAGKAGPMSKPYSSPVGFAAECTVRALDKRIRVALNPSMRDRMQSLVDKETAGGLLLTAPLYNLLVEYERTDVPFDMYVRTLFEKLATPGRADVNGEHR